MFINDVHRKEEIQNIAVQRLKTFGIKYRAKKARVSQQVNKYGKKLFKVPLHRLETETVTLLNGQQLTIPKRIHDMCSFILSKVQTEGIFRIEGSKSRQHEIKLLLDSGRHLGPEQHVIDVAVVLKSFLRELPEPLIPSTHNDLFLMSTVGKKTTEDTIECLLLSCLLLPSENLNVLSYLMQFFCEVASFSVYNKMNFNNLSILLGPNIFPIDDKSVPKSSLTIMRICDITRLLIENSKAIGFIPDYIIKQIGQLSGTEQEKRRKSKPRSGVFNGLKKMVTISKVEEPQTVHASDLVTPNINSIKKRTDIGLSLKRKKEVVNKLPDCALLNTPFTPVKTPISVNPNGKKQNKRNSISDFDSSKEPKKLYSYMRTRSMKSLKEDDCNASNSCRSSLSTKSLLERRWSAVSSAAIFRNKKRVSCVPPTKKRESDCMQVCKTEFEDIKNRVCAIERRISLELNHVQNNNSVNVDMEAEGSVKNVQTVYQKTLETASLSPTTDQLARRLSKDLRIRRSGDQKIIRSPSARKIGTIRRRSTERERKTAQVTRNQSWHFEASTQAPLLPRLGVRRKWRCSKENVDLTPSKTDLNCQSTFQALSHPSHCSRSSLTESTTELWRNAESLFDPSKSVIDGGNGDVRASIAKLRSQNVGMVRAKARLFDKLKRPDSFIETTQKQSGEPARISSRRPKSSCMLQKQKLQQIGRHYVKNSNKMEFEGMALSPRIKSPLTLKTPKRLCRTPTVDKRTPFRVLATPM
ncbi:rho GTPase-activating protein 11A-like isoform X2 [Euwallacea fornicatus]|uniref:rho GTPase-activating protein 11A-like isoform X2 n=1 Tax=Euwallacea fornicatus TaxID=995702 RepID=UPI00338EA181